MVGVARQLAGLVCALAALVPSSALAARPESGHYYAPSRELDAPGLDLRVSPRRVEVARVLVVCGRAFTRTVSFRAASEGTVGRGGKFAMAGRRGGLRYSFRGRFASPHHASLTYRVRFPVPTVVGRPRQWCSSGDVRTEADLNGDPPYSGCRGQPRSTWLLSTATGRVFQQPKLVAHSYYVPYVYACSFDAGRRVTLGPDADPNVIGGLRLTGQFVAYVRYYICGSGPCPNSLEAIDVRDLRDGSLVREASRFSGSFAGIDALELAESGAMAWTLTSAATWDGSYPLPERSRHEVWAHDSAGERVLDSGPEVDPKSLQLSGSTVSWTNGGVTRSEELR
jgi:hypothetical protein